MSKPSSRIRSGYKKKRKHYGAIFRDEKNAQLKNAKIEAAIAQEKNREKVEIFIDEGTTMLVDPVELEANGKEYYVEKYLSNLSPMRAKVRRRAIEQASALAQYRASKQK